MPRLLLISMPSVHFTRWVSNLEHSEFELYWFDILNRGEIKNLNGVTQFVRWKQRKKKPFRGEYTLSKRAPKVYQTIEPLFQTTIDEALTDIINEVKPDIIHSFQMQDCTYPILKTMRRFPNIPWIYSCWGSDLFYYQQEKKHRKEIKKALTRINYFHADNQRDFDLATSLGFKGKLFGIIPGGGGYDITEMNKSTLPMSERTVILVKGYQHHFGRAKQVLDALREIKEEIDKYEIIVFGAHEEVFEYRNHFNKITIYHRNELHHNELFTIMCKSKIYIGNSISDGIPNTLLESMIMGVFPIQSNPGNATAEVIAHGKNGFLISDPYNTAEIKKHVLTALSDNGLLEDAREKNMIFSKEYLAYDIVRDKIEFSYLSALKN